MPCWGMRLLVLLAWGIKQLTLQYVGLPNSFFPEFPSAPTPVILNDRSLRQKVHRSNFSHGSVTEKYITPLLADLVDSELNESNETKAVSNTI